MHISAPGVGAGQPGSPTRTTPRPPVPVTAPIPAGPGIFLVKRTHRIIFLDDTYVLTHALAVPAISAAAARAHLHRIIDQVNDESEPLIITGRRGNAVLVGEDDWRAIQETLRLASVPGLTRSTRGARGRSRRRLRRTRLMSA